MGKSLETSRQELQAKLEEILGSESVYFQPPETVRMNYPAIVYDLYRVRQRFADDIAYRKIPGWTITVIERNAEVDWVNTILDSFKYCSVERVYVADNLMHYSFIVYYS